MPYTVCGSHVFATPNAPVRHRRRARSVLSAVFRTPAALVLCLLALGISSL
uniref:Uncharacterized protein n=1 Tax=Anguilla anguilla TaxID=7936 RepID=A0A0E9RL80_ANGAN